MANAHEYPEIYDELGIDLRTLGCLMLKVEPVDTSFIADEDLYVSPDPKKHWIAGRAESPHVTLRYGFLPGIKRKHVDRVLEGMEIPEMLWLDKAMMFPSPYPDEPYECIVMRVAQGILYDFNRRLGLLPNVATFDEYRPHVTLAYVRPGWWAANADRVPATAVKTLGFDYGEEL